MVENKSFSNLLHMIIIKMATNQRINVIGGGRQ